MRDEINDLGQAVAMVEEKMVVLEGMGRLAYFSTPHLYAQGAVPRRPPPLTVDEKFELTLLLGKLTHMSGILSWTMAKLG